MPYAITIPFDGVPLPDQRAWYEECAALGYTDLWSIETNGADGFVPLALAATWVPGVRLGTSIVPVFTRGPGAPCPERRHARIDRARTVRARPRHVDRTDRDALERNPVRAAVQADP